MGPEVPARRSPVRPNNAAIAKKFRCRRGFPGACWSRFNFHPFTSMAKSSRKPSAPLTFDLPVSLIAQIETCRRGHGFKTASEVVRMAISGFDFEGCEPARDPHRQISVRITAEQRSALKRFSRQKDASVGELLRLALEAMPTKPAAKKK